MMEQTATGLFVLGWKLAVAVIAGIPIFTTTGVWLLARFTGVFDAYAEERAKLLAQFHNLDRLVEQTERLTATTEKIKAQISDEMWDRQRKWDFKKELYIRLLETVGEFQANLARWKAYRITASRFPNDATFVQKYWDLHDAAEKSMMAMIRMVGVGPLVFSPALVEPLHSLVAPLEGKDFGSVTDDEIDSIISVLQRGLSALQQVIREDLRLQA